MKIKIVIFVITILLLGSCNTKKESSYERLMKNGVRITENSTTPADSTFKVDLKKIATFYQNNGTNKDSIFRDPSSQAFDGNGNLFILDRGLFKIFKYTNGKLIKIFGREGQGPGEFIQPGNLIIKEDTLIATDTGSYRINKFDLDGHFLSYMQYEDIENFPWLIYEFGDNYICYGSNKSTVTSEGKNISVQNTDLYDKDFKFVRNIYSNVLEELEKGKQYDPLKRAVLIAWSDSNVYIYKASKTLYRVEVFDMYGNKVREIRKNYTRRRTPDHINKIYSDLSKKMGINIQQKFINSVSGLKVDKYNRLWVQVQGDKKEDYYTFDIFEDDIFINRIKLDKGPEFVDDKAVEIFLEMIKVYDY